MGLKMKPKGMGAWSSEKTASFIKHLVNDPDGSQWEYEDPKPKPKKKKVKKIKWEDDPNG